MGIDKQLCDLPLIGKIIKRLYTYFREHIAFTDFIHIMLGLGLGLIIAGNDLFYLGIFSLFIGILGHVYAFIKAE